MIQKMSQNKYCFWIIPWIVVLPACSLVVNVEEGRTRREFTLTPPTRTPIMDASVDVPSIDSTRLGVACSDDSRCGGLRCDLSVRLGECTLPCDLSAADRGASVCAPVAGVCVSGRDRGASTGHCARACEANRGQCMAEYLCYRDPTDPAATRTACQHYCQSDQECLPSQRCNTRLGRCGQSVSDPTKLEDGRRCVVPGANEPNPCQGECQQLRAAPAGMGICTSFVRRNGLRDCLGGSPMGFGGYDELKWCYLRACDSARCCPDNLSCVSFNVGTVEGYCWTVDLTARADLRCGASDGGSDAGPDAAMDDARADARADAGGDVDAGNDAAFPGDSAISDADF